MSKRCPQCGEIKPLDIEHFTPRKRDNDTGEILDYAGWCKPCAAAKSRQRRAHRTPEQIEADRAYNRSVYEYERRLPDVFQLRREQQRRYRQSELGRATSRAWARAAYQRMKENPERHAAYLEAKRIQYHLQRLEVDRPVRWIRADAVNSYASDDRSRSRLPPGPFVLWLHEVLVDDRREFAEIAAAMDVHERTLRRYLDHESKHIERGVAEHAVWTYRRALRIHPRRVEDELAALEDYWRQAPGNGSRLVGYLRDAEPLVVLSGVVVECAADLWPGQIT